MVDEQQEYDLAVFEDFAKAVNPFVPANHPAQSAPWINVNGYYCVVCAGKRRVSVRCTHWPLEMVAKSVPLERASEQFIGATLFDLTCVQCHTSYTALVHEGLGGRDLLKGARRPVHAELAARGRVLPRPGTPR
jgi:hypothetical protein